MRLTDAAGKVYLFTRQTGTPPLITRITDPARRFVEFGYDASRRMISYKDQGGGVTALHQSVYRRIPRRRLSRKVA
ncbi:MAG: hypothetical protein HY322_09140 [Betaproteobacteria bacterium]|nr:hypothetical protein [Betaproteobacteria bacterium]